MIKYAEIHHRITKIIRFASNFTFANCVDRFFSFDESYGVGILFYLKNFNHAARSGLRIYVSPHKSLRIAQKNDYC